MNELNFLFVITEEMLRSLLSRSAAGESPDELVSETLMQASIHTIENIGEEE